MGWVTAAVAGSIRRPAWIARVSILILPSVPFRNCVESPTHLSAIVEFYLLFSSS